MATNAHLKVPTDIAEKDPLQPDRLVRAKCPQTGLFAPESREGFWPTTSAGVDFRVTFLCCEVLNVHFQIV